MSDYRALGAPASLFRELRAPLRFSLVIASVTYGAAAAVIDSGNATASQVFLIGIAVVSMIWAGAMFGIVWQVGEDAAGDALRTGIIAVLVSLLCVLGTSTDTARGQTIVAAIAVAISALLWMQAVTAAGGSANIASSVGALAALAAVTGLILLPVNFDPGVDLDSAGLLIAVVPPLGASLLVTWRTRRALYLATILAIAVWLLFQTPDDITWWVAASALCVLLFIGDQQMPVVVDRTRHSLTVIDALLVVGVSTFLIVSLALSLDEPVRGFYLGALFVMVAAVAMVQSEIISERDLRFQNLAILAASIRERAQLDALTGLPNRAALDTRLAEEVERAVRYRQPLSICFIDIDHFKSINDAKGHGAGDQVLREIGQALRNTIRTPDYVARFGGEEFVVIAPGTWTTDAAVLGNRIQAAISENVSRPLGAPVTVSIGIAGVPEHGRDSAGVLQVADLALYAAKHAGRNRVELGFIEAPLPPA